MSVPGHRRIAISSVFRWIEKIALDCANQTPPAGLHKNERNEQGDCPANQHRKILSLQWTCFKAVAQHRHENGAGVLREL